MFSPSPRPGTPNARYRSATPVRRRQTAGPSWMYAQSGRTTSLSQMSVASDASMASRASSEMDIDGVVHLKTRSEVVFAQSEEQKVTLLAHLPAEVLQVLRNTDFVSDSFTGDIDTRNSFCLIASVKTCFVWKHAQLMPGAPTCYIFPCPNRYSEPEVPFCALVAYGSSREPGLILLSPYGELRFWDSIGLGLTGGAATDDSQIDLRSDETITGIIYAVPQTFVATSSTGRLFLLTVSSTDGRFRISAHPFSLARPQGTMERLKATIYGENVMRYTGGCITAAAITEVNEEGFEIWTCTDMKIVRWSVYHKGYEQFEAEQDITDHLETKLRETFPHCKESDDLDLELLDIAFDVQEYLVLLASFNAGLEDESGIDTRPRRHYIVCRMKRDDLIEAVSFRTVPYQTISPDRANIHPRLCLMSGGQLYCVQFGDAIALVARDNAYSNILTLQSLRDRTFGCGIGNDAPEMLFMNSEVLIRVVVDIDKINSYNEKAWRGTSIKSIMTQAILFGSNPKNPLLFTFPPDVDEDSLISGAEQLSRAVLTSDMEVVRPNPDLTQQISERRDRLKFLIKFINENAALGKMAQSSRQLLLTDAEKLFAASELWTLYCLCLNSGHTEYILTNSIAEFMDKADPRHHDDVTRTFFRYQTREIGGLLTYISHVVREIIQNHVLADHHPDAICRGAGYALCILQAAWDFRDLNTGTYGIIAPMLNAWTSTQPVVDIALDFFNLSDQLLTNIPPEAENDYIRETSTQLPAIALTVFRSFKERQDWLESPAAADEPNNENERRAFREHFQQVRPQVLESLLKHGKSDDAFQLAEEYRDFRTLANLCHSTPSIYPSASNVNWGRIKRYIEKYKEEFTDELYLWYAENGEFRCLFEHSDRYRHYVDSFLAKHSYPTISWVHDLGKGSWGSASATLITQVDRTLDLETRHVMLSIGKLAQIAGDKLAITGQGQTVIDAYHAGLDYVSVHEKLIEELHTILVGSKSRQSLENQTDIIVKAVAPSLKQKTHPGFYAQFRTSVKELLQNHTLGIEDLLDVLTLKESTLEFGVALELVKKASKIPDARQLSAYRTVWRRIYTRDDWENISRTTNKTDAQLVERFRKTALYEAVKDALRRARDEQDAMMDPTDLISTPDLVMSVSEAAQLPTREELSSRWPGHADEQLDALAHDYENERQRLHTFDLAPIIDRVKDLAVQELEDDLEMEYVVTGMEV